MLSARRVRDWRLRGLGPFATLGGGVTVYGAILAATLAHYGTSPQRVLYGTLVVFILSAATSWLLAVEERVARLEHFIPLSFASGNDRELPALLRGEAGRPAFAKVAARSPDLPVLLEILEKHHYLHVRGTSGQGKSTLGYQMAYEYASRGHSTYLLNSDSTARLGRQELRASLARSYDRLRGKTKLILVDDAHLLDAGSDVQDVLRARASDTDARLVWISTDEDAASDEGNGVAYQAKFSVLEPVLRKHLVQNREVLTRVGGGDRSLQEAVRLVEEGHIDSAWQFVFVAGAGDARLTAQLDALSDAELALLLLLSLHTVISGSATTSLVEALVLVDRAGLGWLAPALAPRGPKQVFEWLADKTEKRHPLLLRRRDVDRSTVLALPHYNVAREVIRRAAQRQALSGHALVAVPRLLPAADARRIALGALVNDLGQHALVLAGTSEWLKEYWYSTSSDVMSQRASFLRAWQHHVPRAHTSAAYGSADQTVLAAQLSRTTSQAFVALADLLRLDSRGGGCVLARLDIVKLSHAANAALPGELQSVAELIRALGDRGQELIDALDLEQVAASARALPAASVQTLPQLLRVLRHRRLEFLQHVDMVAVAARINETGARGLSGAADLVTVVDHRRRDLIDALDLPRLAATVVASTPAELTAVADFIRVLRHRRQEFVALLSGRPMEAALIAADPKSLVSLQAYARAVGGQPAAALSSALPALALRGSTVGAGNFDALANFIGGLAGAERTDFLQVLNLEALARSADAILPEQLGGLARLLGALGHAKGRELVGSLSRPALTEAVSACLPAQYEQAAALVEGLRHLGAPLDGLDVPRLARQALGAASLRPEPLARLIRAMDDKTGLLDALKGQVEVLAERLVVHQASDLLGLRLLADEFDEASGRLYAYISVQQVATTAGHLSVRQAHDLLALIESMGDRAAPHKEAVDWLGLLQRSDVERRTMSATAKILMLASSHGPSPAAWTQERAGQLADIASSGLHAAAAFRSAASELFKVGLLIRSVHTAHPATGEWLAERLLPQAEALCTGPTADTYCRELMSLIDHVLQRG